MLNSSKQLSELQKRLHQAESVLLAIVANGEEGSFSLSSQTIVTLADVALDQIAAAKKAVAIH